jgi:hypothetical protein
MDGRVRLSLSFCASVGPGRYADWAVRGGSIDIRSRGRLSAAAVVGSGRVWL